ncbi:hypothetical protein ACFFX0_11950 [Citricoccus parietis]|uniref:Uncharacterized protein n=1 Tax=Citricoccus parietis TaxID=592307 RepID=A0ABV5FYX9_9MICC
MDEGSHHQPPRYALRISSRPLSSAEVPLRTLRPVSRTVAVSTIVKARLAFCSTRSMATPVSSRSARIAS